MEDNALKIKVPEGILMQSEPEGDIFPCSPDNLLSVFKESDRSEFQENKKKVDFDISQTDMTQSVFDS